MEVRWVVNEPFFRLGWTVAVIGGGLLVLSGFYGGTAVSLIGGAVALAGFGIALSGVHRVDAPGVPRGARRRGTPVEGPRPMPPGGGPSARGGDRSEGRPTPNAPHLPVSLPTFLGAGRTDGTGTGSPMARSGGPGPESVPFAPTAGGPPERSEGELPSGVRGNPPEPFESPGEGPTGGEVGAPEPSGSPPLPPTPDLAVLPRLVAEEPVPPLEPPAAADEPLADPEGAVRSRWSGASLPFMAVTDRSQAVRGDPIPAETWPPILDRGEVELRDEVERLRQQVEELSTPVLVPGLTVLPHPALRDTRGLVSRVPDPPALSGTAVPRCSACGDADVAGPSGGNRCWGCGRPVCTDCFWRYGPGPGLHRCPSCAGKSPSLAISGARRTLSGTGPFAGADEAEWSEGL